ncbi:benzoylformate decarboxylase [Bosea sp. NPDC003192]|uniref:benzoylformate decarboxylase n=1 Tax=Bosea sp. NPDC003192 TaxID=3390551 RepID=UPI003D05E2D7
MNKNDTIAWRSLSVRGATLDLLRSLKIDRVFGNPGSTELNFLRDWPDDIPYILGLQESCVVGMADGYAQATGNAAFVNLHSAAGVGHALGNLFTAFRNKTPLVVTAGQQSRSLLPLQPYLYAEQAAEFPKPYVKWSVEPARPEDVPAAIARAYHTAMQHPRGPTFVSVPSDDWSHAALPLPERSVAYEFGPDLDAIARLSNAIGVSKRPAFVVGPMVDRAHAVDNIVALAERANAAVWASPMSSRCSFPERHGHFAGFLQAAPEPLSAALEPYDLIVVFGAPVFTFHVEGHCGVLQDGRKIWQLTDDPAEAAISHSANSIIGALRPSLAALLEQLGPSGRPLPAPRVVPPAPGPADPIPGAFALNILSRLLPPGAIVVEEAPSHRPAIQRYLPMAGADSFYTMASGGLGYSLPASVGVALARPGRRIVCLVGDGSAMYSIQSLWTAAQHNLPITFLVLNNAGYGAMRAFSRSMQISAPPGIDLPGIDFVGMATSLGCRAARVGAAADLAGQLHEALASDGPFLVDIPVDRGTVQLYGTDH